MLPDEINATLEQAENTLNEETPHNAVTGYIYSEIARAAFSKLKLFRNRGFSYAQICNALEKSGLLPKDSNPYSLRQAFHREKARLKREDELMKLLEEDSDSVSKEEPGKPEKTAVVKAQIKPEPEKSRLYEEAKAEWIKQMSGSVVDTGTGKIVKYPDGSFDF